MIHWRPLAGEDVVMYPSDGFRPVDEMTGLPPIGRVRAVLDIEKGANTWVETALKPVTTPSGVIAYPALGRHRSTALQTRYRLRFDADFYRPWYRRDSDGIVFIVSSYNNTTPPNPLPNGPSDVMLQPAVNYPFQSHIPVLRGVVKDGASDAPVADVVVAESNREKVLTDENGSFGLPLRWIKENVPAPIDATDHRTGRTQNIVVTLPASLGQCQTIVL